VTSSSRGRGRLAGAVAITVGLLVPLATFGAPALARSGAAAGQYGGSGSSQYQYRVTICHLTGSKKHPAHTITVSSRAVKAHLRHGDHLGPCTGNETRKPKHHGEHSSPPAAPSNPTTQHDDHGNGQGHGKGDDHGNGKGDDHGNGHHK
jgi:hypothetical protein